MDKILLEEILNFDFSQDAVICSQIDWKGSVPRKDFPAILVFENGKTIGTIGGGKTEFTVIESAKYVMKFPKILVENFELTGTDMDSDEGVCGGKMTILIEPFTKELQDFWFSVSQKNQQFFVLTKVEMKNEIRVERAILNSQSEGFSEFDWRKKQSQSFEKDEKIYLFQRIQSKPMLHIFGAGHVGKAVSELANWTEWDTKIYDDRKDLANSERFPSALEIIHNWQDLEIAEEDFVLVASREHRQDYAILCKVLKKNPRFVGLLSSRRKWKLIAEKLQNDGFSETQIRTIHAPAGVDISSETVPEIAVSIVAEMIQNYRKDTL